jgi:hypothetical protein
MAQELAQERQRPVDCQSPSLAPGGDAGVALEYLEWNACLVIWISILTTCVYRGNTFFNPLARARPTTPAPIIRTGFCKDMSQMLEAR